MSARQQNARDIYATFGVPKPKPAAHVFIDETPAGYSVAFQPKNGPAWRSRRLKSPFDAEIAADVLAEFLNVAVRP